MPRPIKSGRNRQRVLLYDVPESTTDTWGQPSQAPTQIVNPTAADGGWWAEVNPLKGNEIVNTRQIWPTATHRVKMRWLGSAIPTSPDNPQAQIMPQMKLNLLLDNSWLNIIWAENVEKRNRAWEMICEEHIGETQ
jgi:hypothetical protein